MKICKYYFFTFLWLLFISAHNCFAQNPEIKRTWHWYFGNGAGIDFSSGTAVADTNGHLNTYEGCASISDTTGNLLFYTDGDSVWDRNHNMMPNGYGLFGCGQYGSSTQAAVIIPLPGSSVHYYIITTDCYENLGISGLRYTLINMLLNGGNGDVDTLQKNVLIFAPSTEGLAVALNCNKKDFWIIAHEPNNNNFRVYSIDSNGINLTPQIISIGANYDIYYAMFKVSSNGKKMVATYHCSIPNNLAMLFDFNNQNGVISNGILLNGFIGGASGPEFSFNDSILYVNDAYMQILQYDISSGIDSIINNSKLALGFNNSLPYGYLNKAPDGKIYIASVVKDSLSTIDNPNVYGSGCNLNTFNFGLARTSYLGLPEFVSSFFYPDSINNYCIETSMNENYSSDNFKIFPNPASQIINIMGQGIESVIISDVLGRIWIKDKIPISDHIQVDISSFKNGIYNVSLNKINKKILINHQNE